MFADLTIESRMLDPKNFAILNPKATLKEALDKMTSHKLGIACLVDEEHRLVGVLTDGDLRRLLLTRQAPLPALLISPAIEFGHKNPITIRLETNVETAKELMHEKEIWDLPVIDSSGHLLGLLHRHSLN